MKNHKLYEVVYAESKFECCIVLFENQPSDLIRLGICGEFIF